MQPVLAIHHPPIFIPKWWFFCVQNYWVWNAKVVQISKIYLFLIKNELIRLFFLVIPCWYDSSWLVSRQCRDTNLCALWSDPTWMTVRGWCRNYRDLSQTNCGWSAALSRPLANQPKVGLRHCRDQPQNDQPRTACQAVTNNCFTHLTW